MSIAPPDARLVGREPELAAIDAWLETLRAGRGGAVHLVGEPGSGKTALIADARARAGDDVLVLTCRGVEWEGELPFSGMHELFGPVLEARSALPEPQRVAVEAALGLAPAGAADAQLNTFAGFHSLLAESTRDRPVLAIVDDLQWLDGSSLQALAFIARRISEEPIGLLLASRPGTALHGLPGQTIELEPLDEAAVAVLAGRQLGRNVPADVVADLTIASGGNPLAVLESVRASGSEVVLRGTLLDDPLPVGELIERGFSDRIAALSEPALHAAEVVAASLSDRAQAITGALRSLDLPATAIDEAEAGGVLTATAGAVQFAHPLLRALVHRGAEPARLRRAHAALGEAIDDPGLSAWHAASAVIDPDEAIAARIDAAAEDFVSRGGLLAASRAMARAADLTPDPALRDRRRIRAADTAFSAGRPRWAAELVAVLRREASDPSVRLRAEYISTRTDRQADGDDHLTGRRVALAEEARGVDVGIATLAVTGALYDALVSCSKCDLDVAVEKARAIRAQDDLPRWCGDELDAAIGIAIVLTGGDADGSGAELITRTVPDRLGETGDHEFVAEALVWIEEFALAEQLCTSLISHSRAVGHGYRTMSGLWADGFRRFRIGDWDGAIVALDESIRIAEACELTVDVALSSATLSVVLAARGEARPEAQVLEDERSGLELDFPIVVEYTRTALGLAALAAGRGAAAAAHLEQVRALLQRGGQLEPCVLGWHADLVEAYLLAGELETAAERLEEFRTLAEVAGRPWAVAGVARLDGLMAGEDDYEAHFLRALGLYEQTIAPFDEARTRLAYGTRLRRSRRRVEAREALTAALEIFDRLRAAPWSDLARRELGASAPTLRRGSARRNDDLTPQEMQVAQLVAGGASNNEVAGAMFLSPKTIETHLSRIYRKLGVSSRTQLAAQMHGTDREDDRRRH